MIELEFEEELYDILDKYDNNWRKEPLDSDEVDKLVEHLRSQLDLINGNITKDEYIGEECGIEKETIYKKLDSIKKGEQLDFNIFADVREYKNYVKLGRNSKERLQILIMCYVDNPTIEELNSWTINKFAEYVKETDDEKFYEQDILEINKCVELINEDILKESEIMSDKWKETSSTYRFLKDIVEDMSWGETDIEYDIDKSINEIMEDDYLWDNFYNELYSDLVEKGE